MKAIVNTKVNTLEMLELPIPELEVIGSNTGAGSWEEAAKLAINGSITLEKLISHRLPANRFQEGIDMMFNKQKDVIKIVLEW